MREKKALRKKSQNVNRNTALNYLRVIFQKAFLNKQGTPQEKLESGIEAVENQIKQMIEKQPHQTGFFRIVADDFKTFLIQLEHHSKVVESAVAK